MLNLFKSENFVETQERKEELEKQVKQLEKDNRKLKEEYEDLKLKKKMEEEDIKHMVKIKEERMEVENSKKTLDLERKKDSEVAKVKDEYRDKIEKNLEKEMGRMQEMYKEILARLPNVNVKMRGEV